ncbi:hypothetical protein JNM05_04050 [bacterium]|nr:hypothetical protein [bacterium]
MIKINLLHNQLSTPVARESAAKKDEPTGQTFRSAARKGGARVMKLTILFISIIGGGIFLVMERYTVVNWVEQYTGPLNILPPVEEAPSPEMVEEQRREKIRQLYMANTIRQQTRDIQFLNHVNTVRLSNPAIFVSEFTLDGNDYAIDFYGRTEKEVIDFTNAYLNSKTIDETRPEKIERDSRIAGFRFKRSLTGTLRLTTGAETDSISTVYIPLDKAKKKVKLLALSDALQADDTGKSKESKGVIMGKHGVQCKITGQMENFIKFATTLSKLSLNIEMTRYEITFALRDPRQRDIKKMKPDAILFDYNVLIPTTVSDSAATDGK